MAEPIAASWLAKLWGSWWFCIVYRKTHTLLLLFPPWDQCKQQRCLDKHSESCSQNHVLHSQRLICILLKPPKVLHERLLHCQGCKSVADKEKFWLLGFIVLQPPPPMDITTWRGNFCKIGANFQFQPRKKMTHSWMRSRFVTQPPLSSVGHWWCVAQVQWEANLNH